MTIVLVGGGSGGHITPILAVAEQLKKSHPEIKLVYIGQKGDRLAKIPADSAFIDEAYSINAGKFRRYHGEGLKQLLDIPTTTKNIRDFAYVNAGIIQSLKLLKKINPAVVFIKGGFVGLPVGLAAAKLKIPYITHDSDAIPGLANRIIAKWASLHAVAMPKHLYSYPQDKTVYVGVPISSDFVKVDDKLKKSYRQQLGLSPDGRIVMVTGGGLGAQRLNQAVETSAGQILTDYPDLVILHLTGSVLEASTKEYYESNLSPKQLERVRVVGFTNQLYLYSGAADVVISRAGATNMSEFAAQAKACIIMPNPILTGGHQTKNAQHLQDNGAIRVVTEDEVSKDSNALTAVIKELLEDQALRSAMAEKLHHYHKPSAAADLANQILGLAGYEV